MKRPPVIVVQLIHISGPMKGEIQEFHEPAILIGRHPSCNLHFPSSLTGVSRKHAEITREGNQFKLIDHSTNGTFVNGKRVKEVYLKNGDVLEFSEGGPKVSFLTEMKEGVMETAQPESFKEPERKARVQPYDKEPSVGPQRPMDERPPKVPPKKEEPPEVLVQPVSAPLVIQYGPQIRNFKQLPVTIGKSPKCEFVLDHPGIFDQHAQFFFNQGQYWIKDLSGQKLILINRQPIGFQAPLKVNDDLALSPQGPFFHVFGEGRLGEIEEVQDAAPLDSSKKMEDTTEKKGPKGMTSKFKKIFGS